MLTSTLRGRTASGRRLKTTISHRKVPFCGKMLSAVCHPFMYLLSGDIGSSPQRTHPWNHRLVPEDEAERKGFNQNEGCVITGPSGDENHGRNIHLPHFGGPRQFVVLTSFRRHYPWHVAWEGPHTDGLHLSLITLIGPVRMLVVNNHQTKFYGTHAEGEAIPIKQIGEGVIGVDEEFRHLPLL